ncbi:transposase [Streptomyces sp. CA-251387]|uniref:transposase n=1 Tax=Streptomyces sp. CA-251387 TaxID=3240064 RepID=UPI003D8A04CC
MRACLDAFQQPHETGGETTGPPSVDRGKTGCNRHLICDGKGTPFKVITITANVNAVAQTLALGDGIPPVAGKRDRPRRRPDALLGDKGYDSNPNRREFLKRRILPSSASSSSSPSRSCATSNARPSTGNDASTCTMPRRTPVIVLRARTDRLLRTSRRGNRQYPRPAL